MGSPGKAARAGSITCSLKREVRWVLAEKQKTANVGEDVEKEKPS